MIKKFKEFDNINELKHSTYQSASSKLRRMGGIHKSRAENIDNWSYISLGKPFGTFNMHFDIISIEHESYKTKEKSWNDYIIPSNNKKDSENLTKLQKKGPLPVYLCGGLTEDINELYGEEYIEDMEYINIMFSAISEECIEPCSSFFLKTNVIWEDGYVKIVNGSSTLTTVNNEVGDGIALFSDRKSAVKFKNVFLKTDNLKKMVDGFEDLRVFFMEYSTAEEWDNYFKEIQSISINKLYQ